MPFHLNDRDFSADLNGAGSVLIVPCRFCPAASLAVRETKPYIQLFSNFLRTPSYESHIQGLRARLEGEGTRTEVFDSKLPHQFVVCMWTSGRRKDLARRAAGYDAVIVLGCDAAVDTVRSCVPSDCRVLPAMEVDGIMSAIPSFRLPFDISLEVSGVTPVMMPRAHSAPIKHRA